MSSYQETMRMALDNNVTGSRAKQTTLNLDNKHSMKVFAGNANIRLAEDICSCLDMKLASASVSKFSNGETSVLILETARGEDVFIVQPICNPSANDYLMELLIMTDALKRGSTKRITAVVTSFGYCRQDKKEKSRAPITAKLIANMMQCAGIERMITVDLHSPQIGGFFDIPVENVHAEPLLVEYIEKNIIESGDGTNVVIVSPDVNGVKRAKAVSDLLDLDLAILHEDRKADDTIEMVLVGDVKGKVAVIIDDLVDTGRTVVQAANTLAANGAKEVYAVVTHAVLSGRAIERLNECVVLKRLVATDTIPHADRAKLCPKLETITIAPLLAEVIRRTHMASRKHVTLHTSEIGQRDMDGCVTMLHKQSVTECYVSSPSKTIRKAFRERAASCGVQLNL